LLENKHLYERTIKKDDEIELVERLSDLVVELYFNKYPQDTE